MGEQQTKLLQKLEGLSLYAIAHGREQEAQKNRERAQDRLIAEQGRVLVQLREEMAELKKAKQL